MRNFLSRLVNSIKKHKILSAMIVIILVLFAWWAFVNLTPKPLGDKMEYLGKEDLGGILFGGYEPYSVYYYGTDMTVKEIEEYFKGTRVEHPSEDKGKYTEIWLKTTSSDKTVLLYYYNTPSADGYSSKTKKYVVKFRNEHYTPLERSF